MIFFLSACQTTYQTKLTCSQIKLHQVPEGEYCDVDFDRMECVCRQFDVNNWEPVKDAAGEVVEVVHEIQYCHQVAGFKLKYMANKVRPNVKALAQIRRNFCE